MEVKAILNPILKWWWLILVATLLAATTSFIATRQEPVLYQSRATLLIGTPFDSLNPDTSELWLSSQLAETYAGFAYRDPVREATMETLGLEWLPEYYASIPPNTQFIEIYVVDTNPQRAQMVANELANQLIKLSPSGENQEDNNRQGFIDQQLDDLQRQIGETKIEIEAQQIELGNYVSAREIADAQNQINALQSKLSSLQLNYATLLSNSEQQATNTLTIIEPALVPQVPISSQTPLIILISAVLGASLAVGAAFLLEFLNTSIESQEEVEQITNLSVLTNIPNRSKKIETTPLITIDQPREPISEMFRDLRTKIQFSELDKTNRTILITSSNPGEGKSFVSANLACVLARAGFNTLLIDADIRYPDQHKIFNINNKYGLTDILQNLDNMSSRDKKFSDVSGNVTKISGLSLEIITRGTYSNYPSELLGSPEMKDLLSFVAQQYDFVLVDSAPSLSLTDSLVLGRRVGGVLLVVSAKGTKRNQVKELSERYRGINANLLGVILNKVALKKVSNYYEYSYEDIVDLANKPEQNKTNDTSSKNWEGTWIHQITAKLVRK